MDGEKTTRWFLHVDLDAFFASVEQLDNPDYRGKPVIVGGKPEDRRSVVSTASYEARVFGVHSAMPTFQAYKLCPQGIFVHGRMHRYAELSHQIMNIFRDYSPDVDQMSIDEAFIDLTGTEKLFGPPEETARKIKDRVKKETDLTVSVGLATTKYLAKIASGLSKPDGFYHIKNGSEESFMLNLPLTKVWGLGQKSLELIRSKGMNSTRDIYEKDYDTLEFLFGKNMAVFLYNVVRGIEKDSFTRETKSHSISAETTFPYDLTDIYTIETELLELAQGVFFRLLKEESFSRTAFVKIRYEDFSTCTVQETVDRNIITLDTFFEIIKRLFEKRYENGRGIRLLGVGFENIVKEEKPYQQELFNTKNDEKKQAVEKAILSLSKKHPEIKVSKARTLKAVIAATLLTLIPATKIYAQQEPEELSLESPPSLFDFDINDKNHVELTLDGFWEGRYEQNFDFSFGNGTKTAFSPAPPVFKQDVELSTLLMLNNHWYFEADFADEFKKNTLAAGYVGEGLVRSARLSNRGITMPQDYSSDFFGVGLSGGDNQAPGFSMHLASPSDLIQADFLLRYDMTSVKSTVFYGMNKVSDTKINLSDYLSGREFRFPSQAAVYLSQINAVYVESNTGTYKDKRGKKYRKLSPDEYAYLPSQNILLLSVNAASSSIQDEKKAAILLTFFNDKAADSILDAAGSYKDESSFLGKIQQAFGRDKYRLEDFTGRTKIEIEGKTALVLQDSTGFSPFLSAQYYDAGSSLESDIYVISKSTELIQTQFDAVDMPEYYTALFEDFFNEKHRYVRIVNNESDDETISAFPFAKASPQSYLNLNPELYGGADLCILIRNYTPQKELNIGKNAAAGTVLVYKNGILLRNTVYDKNTGNLTLSEGVSATDKITVTWQEDNTDLASGAAVLGAGIKAQFLPCLKGDLIFTGRWPVNFKNEFAVSGGDIKNGFAALSSGITYERNNFNLTEKASFSVKQENTSGGLVILNVQNPVAKKYYFEQNDSINTKKDSQSGNWCVELKVPDASEKDDKGSSRSYSDINLSGGNLIINSDILLLTLKPDFTFDCTQEEAENSLDIYLVLGVEKGKEIADEDFTDYPFWKLNGNTALNIFDNRWQTVTLTISDGIRSRLGKASEARLLIVRRHRKSAADVTAGNTDISGGLLFGGYEPVPRAAMVEGGAGVLAMSKVDEYESKKYASLINWTLTSASHKNEEIKSITYFSPSDFSSYKKISWDFSARGTPLPVTLFLDNGQDGQNAVKLYLDQSVLKNLSGSNNYHHLEIALDSNEVYIDGSKLPSGSYTLFLNSDIIPCRQKIILSIPDNISELSKGEFSSGVIAYEESKIYCNFQNYTAAEYKKEGNIITAGSFPLLKDAELFASSHQDSGNLSSPDFNIKSEAKAKSTISGITTQAELTLQKEIITQAGHTLKTDSQIIPVISAEENYRLDTNSTEIKKKNSFGLDFSRLRLPVIFSLNTKAEDSLTSGRQNADLSVNWNQIINKYNFGLNSKFEVSQKVKTPFCIDGKLKSEQYFDKWASLTNEEFSTGKSKAANRNEDFSAELFSSIPFTVLTFAPKLSYALGGEYSNAKEIYFSDKEKASLLLPCSFDGKEIAFELVRNGGGTLHLYKTDDLATNGSYKNDFQKVLSLQSEREWFYTSLPFYELFDTALKNKITGEYSTKYEIRFNRRLFNSFADLYVPSSSAFAVSREIKKQFPETADVWQLKLVLTNTSINNFGKNSLSGLFPWFMQEEVLSRFTGILKIPSGTYSENIRYQINEYLQIMLYLKEKTTVTTSFDITLANNPDWNILGMFIYERPSQTSLITAAAYLFFPDSKAINFDITRKDSLSVEVGKNLDELSQKYSFSHSADLKFKEHYSVNGGIGFTFTNVTNRAQRLSLNLTLGAKAEF